MLCTIVDFCIQVCSRYLLDLLEPIHFSKWTDFTGSVKSIISQFKEQDIVIHSKRDSQQELSKTVEQASQTSALLLGVVVAVAGFFGFRFQNDIVSGIVAFGSVMTLLEYVIIEMQENGKDSLIFKSLGWA